MKVQLQELALIAIEYESGHDFARSILYDFEINPDDNSREVTGFEKLNLLVSKEIKGLNDIDKEVIKELMDLKIPVHNDFTGLDVVRLDYHMLKYLRLNEKILRDFFDECRSNVI